MQQLLRQEDHYIILKALRLKNIYVFNFEKWCVHYHRL